MMVDDSSNQSDGMQKIPDPLTPFAVVIYSGKPNFKPICLTTL